MNAKSSGETKLNLRLPAHIKQMIEQAALLNGQTVRDFAISSLEQAARAVLDEHGSTVLSERGRDILIALINGDPMEPNEALKTGAQAYKRWREVNG